MNDQGTQKRARRPTLFTIRSEWQLMEQLNYNLLFRWFVGLNPDDAVWVPTVFTKNRQRLIDGNIADAFLQEVLKTAETHGLLSHEHCTVDGTLLEAWASQTSFRPKDDPSAYSGQSGHLFRFNSATHSGSIRPSIPDQFGHLQRVSSRWCHVERRIG